MEQDTWLTVDETGHVPGVAAELPHGHKALLDASGNIMAIVAIEEAIEAQQESDTPVTPPVPPQTPLGSTEAITPLAPETPLDASVSESATPVAEPVMSEQANDSTSIQAVDGVAPDNDATPIAVGGTEQEEAAPESGNTQE